MSRRKRSCNGKDGKETQSQTLALLFYYELTGGFKTLGHLFAVHHLMIKEEKHSLLTLDLRLGHLGQLSGEDKMRASAEDVFTLKIKGHLLYSLFAIRLTGMKWNATFYTTSQSSIELCHRTILSMFSRRRFLSLISLATFFIASKAASTSL